MKLHVGALLYPFEAVPREFDEIFVGASGGFPLKADKNF